MFAHLTEATKRRFIEELRSFWSYHPKYTDLVNNIQGKYSFQERPQYSIICKTSSANPVQLSADNFQCTVQSYCYHAMIGNKPGLSVEWVKEDHKAIQLNNGKFPSAPGVYFVGVTQIENPNPVNKEPAYEFYVDPLLTITDESVVKTNNTTWTLQHPPLSPAAGYTGSNRLCIFQMPGAIRLEEGVEYTVDYDTGVVSLTNALSGRRDWLSADYLYAGTTTGPWAIIENFAHKNAIPGVVLAFGRRMSDGDQFAVVVSKRREPAALEYGGHWEISMDFDISARDVQSQVEITDATLMYLNGILRNRLSTEGLEMSSISMGGESEEVADETGDDYFYNASISLTVTTNWAVYVPIAQTIRRMSVQNQVQRAEVAALTSDALSTTDPDTIQNINMLENMGLQFVQDPLFRVGNKYVPFEIIR